MPDELLEMDGEVLAEYATRINDLSVETANFKKELQKIIDIFDKYKGSAKNETDRLEMCRLQVEFLEKLYSMIAGRINESATVVFEADLKAAMSNQLK